MGKPADTATQPEPPSYTTAMDKTGTLHVIHRAIDDMRRSMHYDQDELTRTELTANDLRQRIAHKRKAIEVMEHNLKVIEAA
jgi:hypothetical protein